MRRSLSISCNLILVGHSAGGLSVTQATHRFSGKIRLAVYLAATMLKLGFWTDQDIKDGVPDLSSFGDVFQLSPQEDSTLAAMLLRPGPILALMSARFKEESDDIDKVKRIFIKTTQDHVVKPHQQEEMIRRWPPSEVYVLDSDHSPFFSTPFLLFGLLIKAAASVGCH
ncbi:hypothetical protein OIU78_022783 [Salix suchowensis]|nr:hypothetical protein OIU78_022783 [Salix suchowensis]